MSGQAAQKQTVNVGLQLFPPPPKKKTNPSRKPSTRRNAVIPQSPPQSAVDRPESVSFSPVDGRQSALGERSTVQASSSREEERAVYENRSIPQSNNPYFQDLRQEQRQYDGGRSTPQQSTTISHITQPPQAHIAGEAPRSQTSFSEAPTLVRSNSNSSHTSIAKNGSPQRGEPVMRSIFPKYNPDLPLEHQAYFPTQTSPTHIPRTIINRQPYSPSFLDNRSPPAMQSPMSISSNPGRFPRGVLDESILEPSSIEELKDLWKVTNGWRVSASEGRSFCLKMSSHPEEPIHTLSSATQPFYTLRVVPTSTSAQMTLTRQDPNKPASSSPKLGSSSLSKSKDSSLEVMSTTLEETARRLPPNDGLVALLYPRAAANMAIDMASKPHRADSQTIIAAAERECGRLVWDADSAHYYLVHPSLATPFLITISSSPAWSRVEYVLEHAEMPRNLVRLVRDGAGSGFLEIDTAVAAKMDAFYVVDVAVAAVCLVAIEEEKTRKAEYFDAPPPLPPSPKGSARTKRESRRWGLKRGSKSGLKMEEFELDLESQESSPYAMKMKSEKGKEKKEGEEKIPGFCGLLWMMVKCLVWTVTMSFKALAKIIIFVSGCLTRKS